MNKRKGTCLVLFPSDPPPLWGRRPVLTLTFLLQLDRKPQRSIADNLQTFYWFLSLFGVFSVHFKKSFCRGVLKTGDETILNNHLEALLKIRVSSIRLSCSDAQTQLLWLQSEALEGQDFRKYLSPTSSYAGQTGLEWTGFSSFSYSYPFLSPVASEPPFPLPPFASLECSPQAPNRALNFHCFLPFKALPDWEFCVCADQSCVFDTEYTLKGPYEANHFRSPAPDGIVQMLSSCPVLKNNSAILRGISRLHS